MKKHLFLTVGLSVMITCVWAKNYSFKTDTIKTDTIRKTKSTEDTSKIKYQPPFRADVYLYGTIDPLIVPSVVLKSHAEEYTEKHIMAIGKVYSGTLIEKDGITMLCIGGSYPNQDLLVIVKKRNRAKFGHPETDLIGHEVGVTGYLSHYKGMLAIKLSRPKDLEVH